MNTAALTISTLLMGNTGHNPAAPKPAADSNQGRPSKPPAPDMPQNVATYNSRTETRSECIEKRSEDFRSTLRDKAHTRQTDQSQESESTDQARPATVEAAAESTQPAQTPQKTAGDDSDNGEKTVKTLVTAKNRGKLATLLAGSQISRPLAVSAKATGSAKVKSIMTDDKAQGLLKGASMTLPRAVLVEKDHPGQNQANHAIQTAGKTVVSAKGLTISQDPGALAATTSDFGRERHALNNPATAKALETPDSTHSKPMPQAADAPNKVTVAAEKMGKLGNLGNTVIPKTEAMGDNLPKLENADPELPVKSAPGAGKSALNSHKQTLTENTANQHNSVTAELLGKGKNHADNAAGDSPAGNSNRPQLRVQVSSGVQAEISNSGDSSNHNAAASDQVIAGSNAQQSVVERFANINTQTSRPAGDVSPDKISAGISDQIQKSIRTSFSHADADQQITVRLNPPELGKVFIKFHEQQDQITGLLEVSKAQTRYQIEQALPQIVKNLQDSGIAVKRLEVSLADQSGQNTHKDQSLQDGWAGQNHFNGGGNDNSNVFAATEWFEAAYTGTEPYEMRVTDNSVNVLV